jgi:histidyl-tRNA synthetase
MDIGGTNRMKYRVPRGTTDLLPDQTPRWRYLERRFREVCALFEYHEIRTPVFEHAALFLRAVGQHTDVGGKEMYTFGAGQDDEAERLALRPEGTAPAMRAIIEHSLLARSPMVKLYYIAPMFRHERPQAGRFRQHTQCGVEAVGSPDPALDAEVIQLALSYLRRLGITGEELQINTIGCPVCRPAFREALRAAVRPKLAEMCGNCGERYEHNPLRILDCKVEDWERLGIELPDTLDYLCEECRAHWDQLLSILKELEIPAVRNPRLVRGLDYYTRTVFEIVHPALGAQSTLVAGGRYDGLMQDIGGEATPAVGFGSGAERVLLAAEALGLEWELSAPPAVFVATLGEAARLPGLKLLAALREAGVPAEADYLGRSLKAQMKQANRLNARTVLILGEDELRQGVATVRDMATSQQETVALDQVVERLAECTVEGENVC